MNIHERDLLVTENIKLVYYLFNHKIAKSPLSVCYQDDILGSGILGLVKAARNFDLGKEVKFSTYASRVIINEMLQHIRWLKRDFDRSVSLSAPTSEKDIEGNFRTLEDTLESPDNIESFIDKDSKTIEEAEALRLIKELPKKYRQVLEVRMAGIPQRKFAEAANLSQSYVSRLGKKAIKMIRIKMNLEAKPMRAGRKVYPNSPKRCEYENEVVFKRDYARYRYLASKGRAPEFVKTEEAFEKDSTASLNVPNEHLKVADVDEQLLDLASSPNIPFSLEKVIEALECRERELVEDLRMIKQTTLAFKKIFLKKY